MTNPVHCTYISSLCGGVTELPLPDEPPSIRLPSFEYGQFENAWSGDWKFPIAVAAIPS